MGAAFTQCATRRVGLRTSPLIVPRVEAPDAFDDRDDFLVDERRLAADAVPTQQNLHHHSRVHAVPK